MTKKFVRAAVVLSAIFLFVFIFVPVRAATLGEGDLVKSSDSSAIYLIQKNAKHVFPHLNVYLSWGYPSDFSTVKTVSPSDLSAYAAGDPVPFRDGSLFRGTASGLHGKSAAAVFAVSGGKLMPIKSSAIYQELYRDPSWKRVTWVPDDLLSKFAYPLGGEVNSSAAYPDGTLVRPAGNSTAYLIEGGKPKAISASEFGAGRYRVKDIIDVPATAPAASLFALAAPTSTETSAADAPSTGGGGGGGGGGAPASAAPAASSSTSSSASSSSSSSVSSAGEPDDFLPGTVQEEGTSFSIEDSEYLNVTLQSSQPIKVLFESVPRLVSMNLDPIDGSAASATLTISGLEANKQYYLYQDSHANRTDFVSSAQGSYSWTQDISTPHHTFIMEVKATTYITQNTVLDHDISGTVEISADNVTLDCAGHSITGDGTGYGVYVAYKQHITVKNCHISQFSEGMHISGNNDYINNNHVENNVSNGIVFWGNDTEISDNFIGYNNSSISSRGIFGFGNNHLVISNNIIKYHKYAGIHLETQQNAVISNNVIENIYSVDNNGVKDGRGIYFAYSGDGNIIENNEVRNNCGGILFSGGQENKIRNNLVQNNELVGIQTDTPDNSEVYDNDIFGSQKGIIFGSHGMAYHNNLINNTVPIVSWYVDNIFDNGYPEGGNYYYSHTGQDIYSGPNQNLFGSDGIVDTPYIFCTAIHCEEVRDNYPFVAENGWLSQMPEVSVAGQYKSESDTEQVPEGATIYGSFVNLRAWVTDPDDDDVRLQVELRPLSETFTGNPTHQSDLVASGGVASLTAIGLTNGQYHWQYRAMDKCGKSSAWVEFGAVENSDFYMNTNPLHRVAVILAEPSDKTFDSSHNKAYFEGVAKEVRDYYCENAFGKWNDATNSCQNGLFNLVFDVYDHAGENYTLPYDKNYYGESFENMSPLPSDVRYEDGRYVLTVGVDGNGNTIEIAAEDRTEKFVWDAINQADADIDYNRYQGVIALFPGDAQQQHFLQKELLFTSWWTPPFEAVPTNSQGETVKNWMAVAENQTKKSWAHEMGHSLGNILTGHHLCDLYPNAAFCDYGGDIPDYLDIMGQRTPLWGDLLDIVSYFSSFSRIKIGWLGEQSVGFGNHDIESLETMNYGDQVEKYDLSDGSYYLLEARTSDPDYSKWDTGFPGNPLIIYKVSPKEISGVNQTIVNVAGAIGAIIPKNPYIPPVQDASDLPYGDPNNKVMITVNGRQSEQNSFKINTNISEYSLLNYIGAVLRPQLTLLGKIRPLMSSSYQMGESGLSGQDENDKAAIAETESENAIYLQQASGPGKKSYLHIFGRKIEQIYEYGGGKSYSALVDLFQKTVFIPLAFLFFLIFAMRREFKRAKSDKTARTYRTIEKVAMGFVIFLLFFFIFSFAVSFSFNKAGKVPVGSAPAASPLGLPDSQNTSIDLDLHAYDEQGNHTGMNYETGEYENNIPGAEASGDLVYDDEWIFVPVGTSVRYEVSSHDIGQYLAANPGIAEQLPDTNDDYEIQAVSYDAASQRYESETVTEQIAPDEENLHVVSGAQGTVDMSGANPPPPQISVNQYDAVGLMPVYEGKAIYQNAVTFKGVVSDASNEQVKLQIELRPLAEPFTGSHTHQTDFLPSGSEAFVAVAGLAEGQYHWQYRVISQAGNLSAWTEFGAAGNVDFECAVGAPAMLSINQFDAAGFMPLYEGKAIKQGAVTFKGVAGDPAKGEVKLEIELRPLAEPFSSVATHSSGFVASGAEVSVSASGLSSGQYHWQYRFVNVGGQASAWAEFGQAGNADFSVN